MTAGANMLLEDVLAILGRVGTVTLRKGTNDVSATPGHVAGRGWTCEIRLAGYVHSGGSCAYVHMQGATAREAADACLAELERYLESPKNEEDRARYEQHHATQVALAHRDPDWRRTCRPPGPLVPRASIEWGD